MAADIPTIWAEEEEKLVSQSHFLINPGAELKKMLQN
jgi:hypothetical protein